MRSPVLKMGMPTLHISPQFQTINIVYMNAAGQKQTAIRPCVQENDVQIQIVITTTEFVRINCACSHCNYQPIGINVANLDRIRRTVTEI